jgi:hypothetical protein
MTFRRKSNRADHWRAMCEDHAELLAGVPAEALLNEKAFRDYLTRGEHRGHRFAPAVDELPAAVFAGLSRFVHDVTQFDMDVKYFDAFNARLRPPRPRPTR